MTFHYENHYEMKKKRLQVMEKNNWKCDVCGSTATEIHHKDETNYNHDESNLVPICRGCHLKIHKIHLDKPIWDVYKFEYLMMKRGLDPKDLSEMTGLTYPTITTFLKKGTTKNSTAKIIAGALEAELGDLIIYGSLKDNKENI